MIIANFITYGMRRRFCYLLIYFPPIFFLKLLCSKKRHMNLTLQSGNEKDLRKMSHEITKIVFLFFAHTMSI
jgi:hypothetical protein